MNTIFRRIQNLYDEGRPAALVTLVESSGSTPRKAGARMIVYPDGSIEGTIGGGIMEKRVIEEARSLIETGESNLLHIDLRENRPDSVGAVCGGELRVYIEPIGTLARLIIFGAGHVGQTLARMARELQFQVVVYDDREEYARIDRFPSDVKVLCDSFERCMEILKPTSIDYIAIMTYRYTIDELLAKLSLDTSARYVGMIGSELKCMRVKDHLEQQGVPREKLERIHAPIGLPIGGHTPAEVAVSVLAEIVKEANR